MVSIFYRSFLTIVTQGPEQIARPLLYLKQNKVPMEAPSIIYEV